jgi:hypothetical protein
MNASNDVLVGELLHGALRELYAFGTRVALRGSGAGFSKRDVIELSAMNGAPGSARAFARTVRDVIDWRGQCRTFFQGAHELAELPPIAVFWEDRDTIIPAAHCRAFAEFVEGVELRQRARGKRGEAHLSRENVSMIDAAASAVPVR